MSGASPQPSPPPNPAPTPPMRPSFWRGLVLGVLLLPLCAWWSADAMSDIIFSLLVPPLCLTIVVAALNAPVRRFVPRLALRPPDLAVLYIFLSVAGAMCAEWLLINVPYIYSYGLFADQNPWEKEHIVPYLPGWFYLRDAAALEDFRRGGYGPLYALGRMGVWAPPLAAWTLLFSLLVGTMLCINTLMREQWSRREKLAFPIVQMPMLLARPTAPAWRSPILWSAFGLMFAIDMLNGLAFLYPSVPSINVRFLVGQVQNILPWSGQPPWTAVGTTMVGLFPYMAAIGLFMPTDLLFSCVFFFFVRKALQIGMEMYGYEQGMFGGGWLVPAPPYFSEQTWGAVFALFLGALASSRGYLRELWRHVVRNTAFTSDEIRPRTALVGLALCLGGLGALGLVCGLAPTLVVGYVGVFLVFSVVLTRMRAQLGPPIHEMAFFGPHQLLLAFTGTHSLPETATVRIYHLLFITNRIHRTHPMPYQLEAYRLGDGTGLTPRSVFWTIVTATVLGVLVGQMAYIVRGYVFGATPSWGEPGNAVRTLADQDRPGSAAAVLAMLTGFSVVLLLDAIRFRMTGFPLHPVGYALSMNFGVDYCWFGLLIVLIIKAAVQHYAGLKGYEKLRMAALGVILAEFSAELIWSTAAMATRTATYSISFYGRAGWLR